MKMCILQFIKPTVIWLFLSTVTSSIEDPIVVTVGADVLTVLVNDLTPFTEYSVSVVGRSGGGEGESSNVVRVTTFEDGNFITL